MHDFDMNTLPEDVCTDQSDFFSEGDATKSCHTPTADRDQECNGAAKKLRLSHEQSALLEQSFNELGTLNPKQKNALAKQLKMRPRQVEVWFQNRRARTKLKQTEVECEYLKRCCDSLTEENKRLEREIRELRAFKMIYPNSVIDHHFCTSSLPAATLTMCPSCQRLSAAHNAPPGIGTKPICCLPDFAQSPKD